MTTTFTKLLLFSCFLFLGLTTVQAQSLRVTGAVNDDQSQPMAQVKAYLFKATDTAHVYKSFLTESDGKFEFSSLVPGNYRLVWVKSDYQVLRLPVVLSADTVVTVVMRRQAVMLKDVVVTGDKELIQLKDNKILLNVSSSGIASTGNAFDIIQRAPGVIINPNDRITISGKTGVQVYIDGKDSHLNGSQLTEYLRNIAGTNLERIEIIMHPSARYDASGSAGIINIVTKKSKELGFKGNLNAGSAVGRYFKNNIGLNGNLRLQKVAFFGDLNVSKEKNYFKNRQNREILNTLASERSFQQTGTSISHLDNFTYRSGLDYFMSKTQTLGLVVNGYHNRNESDGNNQTLIGRTANITDSILNAQSTNFSRTNNINLNLNYRAQLSKKSNLAADADYGNYTSHAVSEINNIVTGNFSAGTGRSEVIRNDLPLSINLASLKSDYDYTFSPSVRLESGLKISKAVVRNNFLSENLTAGQFIIDTGRSNDFKYTENIRAAYADLSKSWKKTSLSIGLRAEQTVSTANSITDNVVVHRSYLNLFPSLSINFQPSRSHQMNFGYHRRIDRPNYTDLNPFIRYYNAYSFEQGNPYLRPQLSHEISLTDVIKQRYYTSLSYTYTSDVSVIFYDVTSDNRTRVTTENLSSVHNISLNVAIPFKVGNILRTQINSSTFYNNYQTKNSNAAPGVSLITTSLNINNNIMLPKRNILELTATYLSPSAYGIIKTRPVYRLDVGWKRSIFNSKMSLAIAATDLLNKVQNAGVATSNNVRLDLYQKPETRQLKVRLTYNLGKSTVKEQRERSSGLEKEGRRVNIKN